MVRVRISTAAPCAGCISHTSMCVYRMYTLQEKVLAASTRGAARLKLWLPQLTLPSRL